MSLPTKCATSSDGAHGDSELLMELGDQNGQTPLHVAAEGGRIDNVRSLLESGADVNAQTEFGQTALHKAAVGGHTNIVCLLLEHGAEMHVSDNRGDTALLSATRKGHMETVLLLLGHGADIHVRTNAGKTALHEAAFNGHTSTIRLLLDREADIEAKDNTGSTAMLTAAYNDQTEAVQLLLDCGADRHATTKLGGTALHVAAYNGRTNTVRLLLEHGLDIHAVNSLGRTALHDAASTSRVETVRLLLERGAATNAMDKDGLTPLSLAIQSNKSGIQRHHDTAKAICDAGALWDESCDRENPKAPPSHLTRAAGVRACVKHWTRQRARDPSVTLTNVPIENVDGGRESVETYLDAIAKTALEDVVRRRKLCVVGASCSGKTSLVKSMRASKTMLVDVEDRTIGIDLFGLDWQAADQTTEAETPTNNRGKYEATIWDFAGQDVYQVAHSLYFSKRTLYLVFVNVETYHEQLQLVDDDIKQYEARLSRWVRDNIFSWVQLILGRQPDAELLLVCSKCDKVETPIVNSVVSDLDQRLAAWATEFANEHGGSVQQEIQKSVQEFIDRGQLCVSVATQETVQLALHDVQRAVSEKPARAYLMPRLFMQVLDAVYDIREAASAATMSVADRVQMLLVPSDKLVEDLMDKIDGLKRRECFNVLGTLHALGDILWFDQERHLSSAGSSIVVLDPRIMLDLVREVVNHELEGREGDEYDALRTHGVLKHSLLSTFPLWRVLCEESHELVLYFKQQLKRVNLAYPAGKQTMKWDSDLIVPAYWKTKKQPAREEDHAVADAFSNEALWQYTVPANVSGTIFDQFIVQSYDGDYEQSVTSTGVVVSKAEVCSASIAYKEGKKPTEDVILIRVTAVSVDKCWRTLEFLVVAMERVLDGYPGLGTVRRHVLRKGARKTAEYDVMRLIKNEVCEPASMVEKVKAILNPPSAGV